MPVTFSTGRMRRSSSATPAACRSPDASPATMRTSGTCRGQLSGECGSRALDFRDDLERHGKRSSAFLSGYDNRALTTDRGYKALEFQTQRLAFGRSELDAVDEVGDVDGRGGRVARVHPLLEAKEFAGPGREVEGDVPAMLKDSNLAHALA